MTVKMTDCSESGILRVTASGRLSHDDYETFEPAVAQLIDSCGKIKILFTMQDFHGWDPGAVWKDVKFAAKHCHDIDKIAMVGNQQWEKWIATICKPFTESKIQYFESGQEDVAQAWLNN